VAQLSTLGITSFMSPELRAILDLQTPPQNDEAFKRAIRDSSIEVKDEYLSFILTQHSNRRFVEEERQRHAERIDAAEAARRHREAIDENRSANRLSKLAIGIAIGAAVIAATSLYLQWRDADRLKPVPQAAAPALLPPAAVVFPQATNAPTTNMTEPPRTP
jgi:hypothetical protein